MPSWVIKMADEDDRVEKENKKFFDFGNFVALNVSMIMDVAMAEERVENNASGKVQRIY